MTMDGASTREAQMSIATSSVFPGFRFCPTDEELISCYLTKKLDGHEDSVQVIPEIELCNFEDNSVGPRRRMISPAMPSAELLAAAAKLTEAQTDNAKLTD